MFGKKNRYIPTLEHCLVDSLVMIIRRDMERCKIENIYKKARCKNRVALVLENQPELGEQSISWAKITVNQTKHQQKHHSHFRLTLSFSFARVKEKNC